MNPIDPAEPDKAEALFVAAHLQASRLAFYLLQSAAGRGDRLFVYGEDAGLYVQPLKELIARLRRSMPRRGSPHEFPEVFQMSVWTIESLAERVKAELAEQRGKYAEALARLANALACAALVGEINQAWEETENPEELVDLAQACPLAHILRRCQFRYMVRLDAPLAVRSGTADGAGRRLAQGAQGAAKQA